MDCCSMEKQPGGRISTKLVPPQCLRKDSKLHGTRAISFEVLSALSRGKVNVFKLSRVEYAGVKTV